jgi:hypothetical protein
MKMELTEAEMAQEYRRDASKIRGAAICHWDWRIRQILLQIAADYEHAADNLERLVPTIEGLGECNSFTRQQCGREGLRLGVLWDSINRAKGQ